MDGSIEKTLGAQVEQAPSDPWAAAFAALDREDEKAAEAASDTGDGGGGEGVQGGDSDLPDADKADDGEDTAAPAARDGSGPEGVPGGPGDLGGADGAEDEGFDWGDLDVSQEGVDRFKKELLDDINQRTITDVAKAYINHGARHTNGRLGATIDDPDICKRDSDGVPRFYNPDTGREFTGDNPRRQAQEWVDDYNRDLANKFNSTCEGYSKKLLEQENPRIAVLEFAPTYNGLDPVRRSMLDSIIEDYEVTDSNGDIIGYSCDLNKALAAVNRQVRVIQQRYAKQAAQTPKEGPSGPALDTPSVGSNGDNGSQRPQFKSVAEAMEWEQDQILARMKGRN